MIAKVFDGMRRYIGFDDADAARITALGRSIRPLLPEITDAFYQRIVSDPEAAALLTGGATQLQRLHGTFRDWLESLFTGPYDEKYCAARLEIGRAHVRIGMPQYLMFAAMEGLWQEIEGRLRGGAEPQIDAKLRSLHKLLALETALMLESYKEHYAQQVRDVERDAVRERLSQAEHLAHIGHLAANLAHEIKNPLAGISGAIQVIRQPLAGDHPHRPILTEVLRQIDRLDGTVKDLLVYARPKPPRFQRCNFARLIERVLTVLEGEPDVRRVPIKYAGGDNLDLFGDENQLEQLLLNLLLNAAQASPDAAVVQLHAEAASDGVRLTVQDAGAGMDEATLRQAFEPFYTTKTKGTGLGLPICRKIVEAHGGTISVQSGPAEGTLVTVRLPRFPPATTGGQESDEYSRLNR